MAKWQERTALMLGDEDLEKLRKAHVLIVGLGGVGAYAAEQLCRAGIGSLTIVDGDVVEQTNRNRQLPALISNEGKPKAEDAHAAANAQDVRGFLAASGEIVAAQHGIRVQA